MSGAVEGEGPLAPAAGRTGTLPLASLRAQQTLRGRQPRLRTGEKSEPLLQHLLYYTVYNYTVEHTCTIMHTIHVGLWNNLLGHIVQCICTYMCMLVHFACFPYPFVLYLVYSIPPSLTPALPPTTPLHPPLPSPLPVLTLDLFHAGKGRKRSQDN